MVCIIVNRKILWPHIAGNRTHRDCIDYAYSANRIFLFALYAIQKRSIRVTIQAPTFYFRCTNRTRFAGILFTLQSKSRTLSQISQSFGVSQNHCVSVNSMRCVAVLTASTSRRSLRTSAMFQIAAPPIFQLGAQPPLISPESDAR